MSLLNDLMHEPGDAEYVLAARRRAARHEPARSRPLLSAGVLFLAGLILAAGAVEWRSQAATVAAERSGLAQRIRAETSRTDRLERDTAALAGEVAALRDRELRDASLGAAQRASLAAQGVATGTVPAQGGGVRVELSDAPPVAAGTVDAACEEGRILDLDLQRLVNGLWAAGAEAISVDGQRLTALTAIRSADRAILVGYRPIDPPYEVLALGDPRTLEARLASGPTGEWFGTLADLCDVGYAVSTVDLLHVPGAQAASVRVAQPVPRRGSS